MLNTAQAERHTYLQPEVAFARLSREAAPFWLDSSLSRGPDGRFSIMGVRPRWILSSRAGRWRIEDERGKVSSGDGALEKLDAMLDESAAVTPTAVPVLPFYGGAVGWFSYDLGRQFELVPNLSVDELATPDFVLAWYDSAVVWDHADNAMYVVGVTTNERPSSAIDNLVRILDTAGAEYRDPHDSTREPDAVRAESNLSRSAYMEKVSQVRTGISRGDYYQLNLVQRFQCPHREPPSHTYLRLRSINPAPFSAFFSAEGWHVLSSSPERFLEVEPDGRVRTCPIKGTRPRGSHASEDEHLRAELANSAKERAELLMIVDLLRNDLGRVCIPGSIDVPRLHAIESFATIHHLLGEIRGQLRPGLSRRELLRAVFPGGSITGAPKVSAMRAIEALEPHRRGIGMGSIGYFSAHGRIDLNIAIRTIISRNGTAYVPVGAGIVWDSNPAHEYEETLVKAHALLQALRATPTAP